MTTELQNLGFEKRLEDNGNTSMSKVAEARAMHEVQAAFVIAKQFPRDEHAAYMKIMKSCDRPFLAEQAIYTYPRGGQMVKGPSIRLAEAMAQSWGNIDFGVKEISQSDGMSVAEAYAIDLESNVRQAKIFHVPHYRDTKAGRKKLTDSRDIYELVANNGARRLRACILGVIPGDVVDAAVDRCQKTMETSEVPIADQIRAVISAFDGLGVKVEHIEKRLGHNLDSIIPSEIVTLRGIFKSIKDGVADRSQFFEISSAIQKGISIAPQIDKINSEQALELEAMANDYEFDINLIFKAYAVTSFSEIPSIQIDRIKAKITQKQNDQN